MEKTMQAIKEIHHIKNKQLQMQLPESFNDKDVEVIVLPQAERTHQNSSENVESLLGALHKYADPAKINEESKAWQKSVKDG